MQNKNKRVKKFVSRAIPPLILEAYRKRFIYAKCSGNYSSWEEAKKNSTGYNAPVIFEKVKESIEDKRKNNRKYYEKRYSKTILTSLSLIKENGKINLIDFGGSLGNTYHNYKEILKEIKDVRWNIVEQKEFVDMGKREFSNEDLAFYYTLDEAFKKTSAKTILFSCVLQYMEEPYKILEKAMNLDFEYILIDRMTFVEGPERITVQKVDPKVYPASFPCWFFNEEKFLRFIERKYSLVEEFDCEWDKANILSKFKGFIFRKKKQN